MGKNKEKDSNVYSLYLDFFFFFSKFNIATDDIDSLRDELKYWRTLATQSLDEEPPPMIINIYLDTSKLTQNQALIVIDDNLRRNKVNLGPNESGHGYSVRRILIETWVLTLK
jgi:hypothetical protein